MRLRPKGTRRRAPNCASVRSASGKRYVKVCIRRRGTATSANCGAVEVVGVSVLLAFAVKDLAAASECLCTEEKLPRIPQIEKQPYSNVETHAKRTCRAFYLSMRRNPGR